MTPVSPVSLDEIRAARERIAGQALRTPLVRWNGEAPDGVEIHLKLEVLQPVGAFKIRGAANAIAQAPPDRIAKGVYTGSAGNMAQGVAWAARRRGIPATAIVPENAPAAKLRAIERLGAAIEKRPFDAWWRVLAEHGSPERKDFFVHPVSDPAVIAGNGTIGLEILEDLPDVDAVVVPYGGGGLSSGIACALRALRPEARVFASEIETAAPLAPSLSAGAPTAPPYSPSFVDGIGSKGLLAEMWPMVRKLLAGSIVVSLAQTAAAIRLLVERHRVVAEGAGGTAVAAALTGRTGPGKIVAVVSGGNIDPEKLAVILGGGIP
ncbi:MAG TPA: pyridoxal-phosphate dependent enzyme [Thermoanaerobaculia bacterium]|nr:pyridoxal-phosphate dependent enzyme [Thermoanaerobaculia bacterium]